MGAAEEREPPPSRPLRSHGGGLPRGRWPVVHRAVARLHSEEVAHQALILEEGLEHSLTDLWLVGCVARVELLPRNDGFDRGGDVMRPDPASQETKGARRGLFRRGSGTEGPPYHPFRLTLREAKPPLPTNIGRDDWEVLPVRAR